MANFSFIDLFAGIGGFRLALESAGGTCLGFSEIAPDAIHTYCKNFKEEEQANFGDITKLKTLPEHDFMTAGVPCQSWSIAGKNLGFDDDRGQLWNDALYLLNKVRPKAFIFENVKGLSDPRNKEALNYILKRIEEAGYYACKYVLNAYDYGVPQTRVRIYIIGFKEKKYLERFTLPQPHPGQVRLCDVLDDLHAQEKDNREEVKARWSLSCNEKGFNDYFLFNDLRNGDTTIHSWDIIKTTAREKHICYLLLGNRRKKDFGELDGNPLSLEHFQSLDATIQKQELEILVSKNILKHVEYIYEIIPTDAIFSEKAKQILSLNKNNHLVISTLKNDRMVKIHKINVQEVISQLKEAGIIRCIEIRYDFKNGKISTGLNGVNRIILPSCKIYPTLVASDTNDFVTSISIEAEDINDFKDKFMKQVYRTGNYRKITKSEACRIQGFPDNYLLPPTRPRWMKLIGNSVAVPVIKMLAYAVVNTGVFEGQEEIIKSHTATIKQLNFLDMLEFYPELSPKDVSIAHEEPPIYGKRVIVNSKEAENKIIAETLVKLSNPKLFVANGNVFDYKAFGADGIAAFVKVGFNNLYSSYENFKSKPHNDVCLEVCEYEKNMTTSELATNFDKVLGSLLKSGCKRIIIPPIHIEGKKAVEKEVAAISALDKWLKNNANSEVERVTLVDK